MPVQNDGAQASLRGTKFGPLACYAELRGELVERLAAIAGGIPELWLADFDGETNHVAASVEVGGGRNKDRHARDRNAGLMVVHGDARRTGGCGFDFDLRVEVGDFPADVALMNGEVGYADFIPGFQPDWPPNATSDKARAPVPPVLVGCFAGVVFGCGAGLRLPWGAPTATTPPATIPTFSVPHAWRGGELKR